MLVKRLVHNVLLTLWGTYFFLTQEAMAIIINPYDSNPETANDAIPAC